MRQNIILTNKYYKHQKYQTRWKSWLDISEIAKNWSLNSVKQCGHWEYCGGSNLGKEYDTRLNQNSHLELNTILNGKTQQNPLIEIQNREVRASGKSHNRQKVCKGGQGKSKQLVDQEC